MRTFVASISNTIFATVSSASGAVASVAKYLVGSFSLDELTLRRGMAIGVLYWFAGITVPGVIMSLIGVKIVSMYTIFLPMLLIRTIKYSVVYGFIRTTNWSTGYPELTYGLHVPRLLWRQLIDAVIIAAMMLPLYISLGYEVKPGTGFDEMLAMTLNGVSSSNLLITITMLALMVKMLTFIVKLHNPITTGRHTSEC